MEALYHHPLKLWGYLYAHTHTASCQKEDSFICTLNYLGSCNHHHLDIYQTNQLPLNSPLSQEVVYLLFILNIASQLLSNRGENAFFSMQFQYGWAQRPMLPRVISDLDASVPISLIYGKKSWMDSSTGERIREERTESYVNIYIISKAGHHIHAEQPAEFNRVVNSICSVVDCNRDSEPLVGKRRAGSFQEESG